MKTSKTSKTTKGESPSKLIDARIEALGDWRGKTLSRARALIKQADPEVVEEWKWGVPVWSHDGLICTGETYKSAVKLTFAKGASLKDPSGLFNSSLGGNTRRAIDLHEGDKIDAGAFRTLIRAAVILNWSGVKATSKPRKPGTANKAAADGHAAIEDWIKRWTSKKGSAGGADEEMRRIVQRVDDLVRRTIPGLHYAIKWRNPFYGLPEQGWIIAVAPYTSHVTVTFFGGADFDPPPPHDPGTPTVERARYVRLKTLAEAQGPMMRKWIERAGRVPGWVTRVHEAKRRPL
jgi:hypothetical protein